MDPPSQITCSPSFSFLSPNPKPIPNGIPSRLHHLDPHCATISDLSAALSTLTDLIQLSQTTLHSFSSLIPATNTTLCLCPFNYHHRLPPGSLFRHFLQCPSSPSPIPLRLIDSLHYPKTLQSYYDLVKQNHFVQTLHDPSAELCFSLDEFSNFESNIFYDDCPGVVTTKGGGKNLILALPGVLSMECANFIGNDGTYIKGFSEECIKLLPSDVWIVRTETEPWNDYPTSYSYTVLRAIFCFNTSKWSDFLTWVIVNSPRYGIVIDVPMGDHILLLFRLCLKAITREAIGSVNCLFHYVVKELNLNNKSFNCPILVQVLTWLACQFSVLYGELNGKSFAINMFKQCLFNSSKNSSLMPSVQKSYESFSLKEIAGKLEETSGACSENGQRRIESDSICSSVIFVSQVAAAVAALHERSSLENTIKAVRDARSLNTYQRMCEYASISKAAEVERQKRSTYRPLLEHDGLLWHSSHNQETNKLKTREELLAEERDYKRRRMSYRGKKLKRNTTQVMRDIIEEYMEEIKQAGGISCFVKGSAEAETVSSKALFMHDSSRDDAEPRRSVPKSSAINGERQHGNWEQLQAHIKPTLYEDDYAGDHRRQKYDTRRDDGHLEDLINDWGQRNDAVLSRKYSPQNPNRSHSRSHVQNNHQMERVDHKPEIKDKKRRNTYGHHESDSLMHQEFVDRYDPSEL